MDEAGVELFFTVLKILFVAVPIIFVGVLWYRATTDPNIPLREHVRARNKTPVVALHSPDGTVRFTSAMTVDEQRRQMDRNFEQTGSGATMGETPILYQYHVPPRPAPPFLAYGAGVVDRVGRISESDRQVAEAILGGQQNAFLRRERTLSASNTSAQTSAQYWGERNNRKIAEKRQRVVFEFDPSLNFDAEAYANMTPEQRGDYERDLVRRRYAAHESDLREMDEQCAVQNTEPVTVPAKLPEHPERKSRFELINIGED